MLHIFCNENDVTNTNSELIDDKKSVGNKRRGRGDKSKSGRSLFKREFHTFRIGQKRSTMFFAQNVLRSDQQVEAISADKSDKGHVDETVEPPGIVESFVHCCKFLKTIIYTFLIFFFDMNIYREFQSQGILSKDEQVFLSY